MATKEPVFNISDENENNDDDDDFSFVFMIPDHSPITADDAFINGQIRPGEAFPIFDQRLLENDIKYSPAKPPQPSVRPRLKNLFIEEELSNNYSEWSAEKGKDQICKKSKSTGFSKIRRFGEMIDRSKSDGKESFMFLKKSESKSRKNIDKKSDKRKTYLPYHKNIFMGFFSNLHPF